MRPPDIIVGRGANSGERDPLEFELEYRLLFEALFGESEAFVYVNSCRVRPGEDVPSVRRKRRVKVLIQVCTAPLPSCRATGSTRSSCFGPHDAGVASRRFAWFTPSFSHAGSPYYRPRSVSERSMGAGRFC